MKHRVFFMAMFDLRDVYNGGIYATKPVNCQ
jgi:hypothetical protein